MSHAQPDPQPDATGAEARSGPRESPRAIDWLEGLPAQERARLAASAMIRELAPGETIFAPTPSPRHVYLLERGRVRMYRLSECGGETTLGYVVPGGVFGELAALGDYARESFAQVAERARVWKVPRDVFAEVIASHPCAVLGVTRQIGERLKRIESRVESLVFCDVRSRVAHMLLELAEDFGKPAPHELRGALLLDVAITQAELATLVGSTRQTVNASLGELEDEGLLERCGRRFLIPDPAALRAAARRPEGS